MADIQKLIAGHAYWADKKAELKAEGELEASSCEGLDSCEDNHNQIVQFGTTCIQKTIDELDLIRSENPNDHYSFEEVWNNKDVDDEICQHCKNVRSLKSERVKASRRLGAIRAAMTRVGRTLDYKENNG